MSKFQRWKSNIVFHTHLLLLVMIFRKTPFQVEDLPSDFSIVHVCRCLCCFAGLQRSRDPASLEAAGNRCSNLRRPSSFHEAAAAATTTKSDWWRDNNWFFDSDVCQRNIKTLPVWRGDPSERVTVCKEESFEICRVCYGNRKTLHFIKLACLYISINTANTVR